MRQHIISFITATGLIFSGSISLHAQEDSASTTGNSSAQETDGSMPVDQSKLPAIVYEEGLRPKANLSVLSPAATALGITLTSLEGPPNFALPDKPSQVRITGLRPLTLREAKRIAEVNSPSLKAAASEVDQARSALRTEISRWYPTVSITANGLPQYLYGEGQDYESDRYARTTKSDVWSTAFTAQARWNVIDPVRVPVIAAARDVLERTRDAYLIALRDLRLQVAETYFRLQRADTGVTIGQQSMQASLVSLRDARARFQAGVATKLEVLEAETQLARDRQLLASSLGDQDIFRRRLATLLNLPQDISPTAATPARVLGTWESNLQESIIAAYAFREELDQLVLDISINNSSANAAIAAVQPTLSLFNAFSTSRYDGNRGIEISRPRTGSYGWNFDNAIGLSASWQLYDGGRAEAESRRFKQRAKQSEFQFASQRNSIRQEVEQSFFNLRTANQNIATTSRQVVSATESLRLARLRFQAGVTTQREVVDTQRDLTQARSRYADAIDLYNRSLARLQRRTGLDRVKLCPSPMLSLKKPVDGIMTEAPIKPMPFRPACGAPVFPSQG
ncbi:TolC family protein [cyanobiont of Ornithocercus magnificus]|nr:TolC family protein [cyanobiont of Ornithocercus magnificus]